MFSLLPNRKLSKQTTLLPLLSNTSHKFEPINPAPPVTKILFFVTFIFNSEDALITKSAISFKLKKSVNWLKTLNSLSFAGFFPVDVPKYSCIVVIHDPDKKKGYYGATVAAPVFKEIAQKIYTNTPIENDIVNENFSSKSISKLYANSELESTKNNEIIPNVTGMPAMDAISLLENFGLLVEVKGTGKVRRQSLKEGTPIKKGTTIILNLS